MPRKYDTVEFIRAARDEKINCYGFGGNIVSAMSQEEVAAGIQKIELLFKSPQN